VGKFWNEIVEDLKDWCAFGRDMEKGEGSSEEGPIYEPVKRGASWDGPTISY